MADLATKKKTVRGMRPYGGVTQNTAAAILGHPAVGLLDDMMGREPQPRDTHSSWESVQPGHTLMNALAPGQPVANAFPQNTVLNQQLPAAPQPLAAAQAKLAGLDRLHQALMGIQQQGAAGTLPTDPAVAAQQAAFAHNSLLDVDPGHSTPIPGTERMLATMTGRNPEVARQQRINMALAAANPEVQAPQPLTHEQTLAELYAGGKLNGLTVSPTGALVGDGSGKTREATMAAMAAARDPGGKLHDALMGRQQQQVAARARINEMASNAADQRRDALHPGSLMQSMMGKSPEMAALAQFGPQGLREMAAANRVKADAAFRERQLAQAGEMQAKQAQLEKDLAAQKEASALALQQEVNKGAMTVAQANREHAEKMAAAQQAADARVAELNHKHALELAQLNNAAQGTPEQRAMLTLGSAAMGNPASMPYLGSMMRLMAVGGPGAAGPGPGAHVMPVDLEPPADPARSTMLAESRKGNFLHPEVDADLADAYKNTDFYAGNWWPDKWLSNKKEYEDRFVGAAKGRGHSEETARKWYEHYYPGVH